MSLGYERYINKVIIIIIIIIRAELSLPSPNAMLTPGQRSNFLRPNSMLTNHIYGLGKLMAFMRFAQIVKKKLDEVIKYFNEIYPTIKFTSKRSTTSIPFLDIKS